MLCIAISDLFRASVRNWDEKKIKISPTIWHTSDRVGVLDIRGERAAFSDRRKLVKKAMFQL